MLISCETQIFVPGNSRVHETAVKEFAIALGLKTEKGLKIIKSSIPAPNSIFIGLLDESESVKNLIRNGVIRIHNTNMGLDAFEVILHKGILYLLGDSERGMLHAVYEIQEYLAIHQQIAKGLHLSGTFHINMRIFHQRFSPWPGEDSDFRYISHMGATHCLVCHDWDSRRNLQKYVVGDSFPNAVDTGDVWYNFHSLRQIIECCLDYGLEPCLWITELPCQGGPWLPEEERQDFFKRYPSDVLSNSGTYQGQVLCFGHPDVQEYYRELIKNFFKQFPEISLLFLFGADSGGEFCCPDSCPRCKGMSKFEQRDRFIRFLVEEGRKVRPGLKVLTTSWHWGQVDRNEFLARQEALPGDSGLFMAAQNDGWQVERQCHEFLQKARKICKDRGQIFIGYDDFQWGDDTIHNLGDIQDFPLGIGAKIRRWHELDADGVFDHWGGANEQISCNSIACREFFLNPLADPVDVAKRIALLQFGTQAGKYVQKAWISLERAHAILSNFCTWHPHQWPMWYCGVEYYPDVKGITELLTSNRMEALAPCKACGITYNQGTAEELFEGVGEAWQMAYPFYTDACRHLDKALELCEDGDLFFAYWWNGKHLPVQKKEHIRRQKIYVRANSLVGREIGIHFKLLALFLKLSSTGEKISEEEYFNNAVGLLKKDFAACMEIVEYFDSFSAEFAECRDATLKKQFLKKADFLKNLLSNRAML